MVLSWDIIAWRDGSVDAAKDSDQHAKNEGQRMRMNPHA
jgi:hypothetical protein